MKQYRLEDAMKYEDKAIQAMNDLHAIVMVLNEMAKSMCPFVRAHAKAALRRLSDELQSHIALYAGQ